MQKQFFTDSACTLQSGISSASTSLPILLLGISISQASCIISNDAENGTLFTKVTSLTFSLSCCCFNIIVVLFFVRYRPRFVLLQIGFDSCLTQACSLHFHWLLLLLQSALCPLCSFHYEILLFFSLPFSFVRCSAVERYNILLQWILDGRRKRWLFSRSYWLGSLLPNRCVIQWTVTVLRLICCSFCSACSSVCLLCCFPRRPCPLLMLRVSFWFSFSLCLACYRSCFAFRLYDVSRPQLLWHSHDARSYYTNSQCQDPTSKNQTVYFNKTTCSASIWLVSVDSPKPLWGSFVCILGTLSDCAASSSFIHSFSSSFLRGSCVSILLSLAMSLPSTHQHRSLPITQDDMEAM